MWGDPAAGERKGGFVEPTTESARGAELDTQTQLQASEQFLFIDQSAPGKFTLEFN